VTDAGGGCKGCTPPQKRFYAPFIRQFGTKFTMGGTKECLIHPLQRWCRVMEVMIVVVLVAVLVSGGGGGGGAGWW
jgi:hypothetical protein